jgi:predicted GNAT family acetyltransferase
VAAMVLQYEDNRIYVENESKELLAEITFPFFRDDVVDIDHTFVSSSLRGRGIADQLMRAAVIKIRALNVKTRATCPYAQDWFKKHPDQADVLLHED